ncbi:MAG: hypothetical protein MUC46_02015, partial [Desulfobacterales bacterium]|nr:hypothetical protein [Desulfobacterales bacterium]
MASGSAGRRVGMPLGVLEPEQQKCGGHAVEGHGEVQGVGDPLKAVAAHPLLEDGGERLQKIPVAFADFGFEPGQHGQPRSPGLCQVEPNGREV